MNFRKLVQNLESNNIAEYLESDVSKGIRLAVQQTIAARIELKMAMISRLNRECDELRNATTTSHTCNNLSELMAKGDDLAASYHQKGRVINADHPISKDLEEGDALFTDPLSEEYCLQTYSRHKFDINTEILKQRFSNYTHLCTGYINTPDPVELDLAEATLPQSMKLMKTIRSVLQPHNMSSEVYTVHRGFFTLMIAKDKLNETATFMDTGHDMVKALVYNQTLAPLKMEAIQSLQFIPPVYISMICQEDRLDYADRLLPFVKNYREVLKIISRYSLQQIENIYLTLESGNIERFSFFGDRMLDTTTSTDIENLNFLTSRKDLPIKDAMTFVGYFSPETLQNWNSPLLEPYVTTVKLINKCDAGNSEFIMNSLKSNEIAWPPFLQTQECIKHSENIAASHEKLLGKNMHAHYHQITGEIDPSVLIPAAVMSVGLSLAVGAYLWKRINPLRPLRYLLFGNVKNQAQVKPVSKMPQITESLRQSSMV